MGIELAMRVRRYAGKQTISAPVYLSCLNFPAKKHAYIFKDPETI